MIPPASALDLLKPWMDFPLGDLASDPQAQLEAFQAMLPGRLPDDYMAVLLTLGQAISLKDNRIASVEPPPPPDPRYFVKIGPEQEFSTLYGLGGGPLYSYNVAMMWELMGVNMPKGLVPIGESTGSQICMDLSEAGHGRIHHWFLEGDPGPNDVDGHRGWGNTFLLAHSFTDLCARLRPRDAA